MPGILLDPHRMNGVVPSGSGHHLSNGIPQDAPIQENGVRISAHLSNGVQMSNGVNLGGAGNTSAQVAKAASQALTRITEMPPEIQHITQDFIPLAKLINRSVQQTFNGLTELVNELADTEAEQIPQSIQVNGRPIPNGVPASHQSEKSRHKKKRIVEWADDQRKWFIKLLVLSQWSRSVGDIGKVIDLYAWINSQKFQYEMAAFSMGELRRNLAAAQLPNPDLATALEVLSTGKVSALPDLGYRPMKPLSAKKMLKLLRKIDHILCVRLALHEKIPTGFRRYIVRDGRVTFVVENEFELDLSIAFEDPVSQFFFIDLRFTFSPSSPVPDGRLREQLEVRLNHILKTDGLSGCHDFLRDLVLSNKMTVLLKQARVMARSGWIETLRLDLIRRTVVLQYWLNRPWGKSWIEIGVKSGRRKEKGKEPRALDTPFLDLRWLQDKTEIHEPLIEFNTTDLSTESTLRSVVALHISSILEPIYSKIMEGTLYAEGNYFLELQSSTIEPEKCYLEMQITKSSFLTILIEPVSGSMVLKPSSQFTSRMEEELNRQKDRANASPQRVAHTRCVIAQEFLHDRAVGAGWDSLPNLRPRQEDGRLFSKDVLRFAFIRQKYWTPNWVLAMTHSMDGDFWWLIETKGNGTGYSTPRKIESKPIHTVVDETTSWEYFHNLELYSVGLICFLANTEFLQLLGIRRQATKIPPFEKPFRLPKISLRFRPGDLPGRLRQNLLRNTGGETWLSETITLTCEGIDAQNQAVYTAKGSPRNPAKFHTSLAARAEKRVMFNETDGTFVMKFTAPVGQSVIIPLLHRLQHLDRVLSAIETIKVSKFTFTSFSLSRIAVVYEQTEGLRLNINFLYKEPSASVELDTFQAKPPRATLDFDGGNPHKRIQHNLTTLINDPESRNPLDEVLKQLSLTLNLMRVFNELQQRRGPAANTSKLSIISRSGMSHQLCYKNPSCRFAVFPRQHRDAVKWIVKNETTPEEAQSWPDGMADALRTRVFGTSTNDWTGLDSGAAADTNYPGPMLRAVDEVVRSFAAAAGAGHVQKIAAAPLNPAPSNIETGPAATPTSDNAAAGASAAEAISLD